MSAGWCQGSPGVAASHGGGHGACFSTACFGAVAIPIRTCIGLHWSASGDNSCWSSLVLAPPALQPAGPSLHSVAWWLSPLMAGHSPFSYPSFIWSPPGPLSSSLLSLFFFTTWSILAGVVSTSTCPALAPCLLQLPGYCSCPFFRRACRYPQSLFATRFSPLLLLPKAQTSLLQSSPSSLLCSSLFLVRRPARASTRPPASNY